MKARYAVLVTIVGVVFVLTSVAAAGRPPEVAGAPAWSPDGRRIAFTSRRDGNWEVYVVNADGSGQRNLSRHPARDGSPAWSPDGRRIAFVSLRDGQSEVYDMKADGSGQRNLSRHPASDGHPVWSPDGRRIAYVSASACCVRGVGYLYVVNIRWTSPAVPDGSGQRRLTRDRPQADVSPAWSRDGRTIRFGPYRVNADGSGQRRLPRNIPWSGAWSPDGRKIADAGAFPRGSRGSPRANYEIVVMNSVFRGPNADRSGQRRLTRSPGGDGNPAWSPDGRKIAFVSHRDDNPEIYVMNADGSGQRNLTRNPGHDSDPAWSPDGRKIAFTTKRGGSYEVYVMNADGSGQRRLTQRGP